MGRYDTVLALALVVALHAGAFAGIVWTRAPEPMQISMPAVQGVLVPVPPAERIKAPPAEEEAPTPRPVEPPPPEPKPEPKPQPKPKPKPKPAPLPPPPEGPPSERAVTAEPAPPAPEPVPETAPPAEPAPAQEVAQAPLSGSDEELAAPVVPPRVDASQSNNPAPTYPLMSRRLREEGTVFLELLIEPDGSVSQVQVKRSSGHQRLDASAMETVRKWRYVPARRGGTAIAFRYVQPIEFYLNR